MKAACPTRSLRSAELDPHHQVRPQCRPGPRTRWIRHEHALEQPAPVAMGGQRPMPARHFRPCILVAHIGDGAAHPGLAARYLFTLNIAVALMVMMVAAYMLRPLDFAAFPSVLLLTTLMRLSLNVASPAWCC